MITGTGPSAAGPRPGGRRLVAVVLRPLELGDLLPGVPAIRAIRAAVPDHRLVLTTTAALQPLAGRGWWVRDAEADAELIRVELRRAARRRGIRLRTGISDAGALWACTPDGFPAEEPWRGAAVHAHESGVMGEMAAEALDRLFPEDG